MDNLPGRSPGRKPEVGGGASTPPIRNSLALNPDLAHPAVTPVADVPPPSPQLVPWTCPSGYGGIGGVPDGVRGLGLPASALEALIFLGHKMARVGHPCYWVRAANETEGFTELGKLLGMPDSTARVAFKMLAKLGLVKLEMRLFRDADYLFVWCLYALRMDAPCGLGADRSDPKCTEPHHPAFILPGAGIGAIAARPALPSPQGAGIGAILGRHPIAQAAQIAQSSAGIGAIGQSAEIGAPPIVAQGAETCAMEDQPRHGVVAENPETTFSGAGFAHVYGIDSSPSKTSTWAESSAEALDPMLGSSVEEILTYLARPDVYKMSVLYTPALMSLAARSIPIPERYAGKRMVQPGQAEPESGPRRFAPPAPRPINPEELTFEARIHRLEGLGDLEEALKLADLFMQKCESRTTNRRSYLFHRRNMKELAAGVMPASLILGELKAFREATAEYPIKAFVANIKAWRFEHILGRDPQAMHRYISRKGKAGAQKSGPEPSKSRAAAAESCGI